MKAAYDKLIEKVDNVDTCGFFSKTKYDTDKTDLENKIPDTSRRVKEINCNTKITETKI